MRLDQAEPGLRHRACDGQPQCRQLPGGGIRIGSRAPGLVGEAAPDVQFPGGLQSQRKRRAVDAHGRTGDGLHEGVAVDGARIDVGGGQPGGADPARGGPGSLEACRRRADVIIVRQGLAGNCRQKRVVKPREPVPWRRVSYIRRRRRPSVRHFRQCSLDALPLGCASRNGAHGAQKKDDPHHTRNVVCRARRAPLPPIF